MPVEPRLEAIASHQRALALQPHYVQAHNNLGLALSRESRFEAALASLEQALKLMPRFPEALLNLGNVLAGLGRDEEAVERYAQALLRAVRDHLLEVRALRGVAARDDEDAGLGARHLLNEAAALFGCQFLRMAAWL